jgi:hypothetical protein
LRNKTENEVLIFYINVVREQVTLIM